MHQVNHVCVCFNIRPFLKCLYAFFYKMHKHIISSTFRSEHIKPSLLKHRFSSPDSILFTKPLNYMFTLGSFYLKVSTSLSQSLLATLHTRICVSETSRDASDASGARALNSLLLFHFPFWATVQKHCDKFDWYFHWSDSNFCIVFWKDDADRTSISSFNYRAILQKVFKINLRLFFWSWICHIPESVPSQKQSDCNIIM